MHQTLFALLPDYYNLLSAQLESSSFLSILPTFSLHRFIFRSLEACYPSLATLRLRTSHFGGCNPPAGNPPGTLQSLNKSSFIVLTLPWSVLQSVISSTVNPEMGSVIVSEIVYDTTRFPPPTMLASPHTSYQPARLTTTSSDHSPSTSPTTATNHNIPTHPPTTALSSAPAFPSTSHRAASGYAQHMPPSPKASTSDDVPPSASEQVPSQSATYTRTPSGAHPPFVSLHSNSAAPSPTRIKIKDLNHIQTFIEDEGSLPSLAATGQCSPEETQELPQYEISAMPVTDVIEMVAGLLTKITTTNDDQAQRLRGDVSAPEYNDKLNPLSTSILAFHGKNIPTISIMSYLTRIHKYCPATYEVFLSLLVYFDRVTDKINSHSLSPTSASHSDRGPHPSPSVDSVNAEPRNGLCDAEPIRTDRPRTASTSPVTAEHQPFDSIEYDSSPPIKPSPFNLAHYFVVDSFNIHRLIIAAVTCASKFFSDVFYTNSRYAKVSNSYCISSPLEQRRKANCNWRSAGYRFMNSISSRCSSSSSMISAYRSQ